MDAEARGQGLSDEFFSFHHKLPVLVAEFFIPQRPDTFDFGVREHYSIFYCKFNN